MEITKELIDRAREDFKIFVILMYDGYKLSKLHNFLLENMQDIIDSKIDRLALSTAPRSGKSLLISILLPAYLLGKNPSVEIMSVSYSSGLASKFSRKVKDMMDTEMYQIIFPWAKRAEGDDRASEFRMCSQALKEHAKECPWYKTWTDRDRPICQPTKMGGFFSAGVLGGITGNPADFLLLDDTTKSMKEANSPAYQKEIKEAWESDIYTRLEPGSRVCITQTRWSDKDLVGIVENSEYVEDWKIINIPALCIDPKVDPLNRREGEAAFPERFTREDVLKIKRVVGEKVFKCLYQQQPEKSAQTLGIKWDPSLIKFVDQLEDPQWVLSWDAASEIHSDADMTAVSIFSYTPGDPELVFNTCLQFKVTMPGLIDAFIKLNGLYPGAINLVERASNGIALTQLMKPKGYDIRDISKQPNKIRLFGETIEALKVKNGASVLKPSLEPLGGLASTLWEEMKQFGEPNFHSDLVITYIQAIMWYEVEYLLLDKEPVETIGNILIRGNSRKTRLKRLINFI